MMMKLKMAWLLAGILLAATVALFAEDTNTFVVAYYNVENWILMDRQGKKSQPKPDSEKRAVFDVLESIRPDVLGLVEIGKQTELAELQEGLHQRGLNLPYQEWIESSDPTRHVALLSRFPITERRSRTDYEYLLEGKPTRVSRGVLDVRVQVNEGYGFHAVLVHLKSKVSSSRGDQAVMRLEEARLVRAHIENALSGNPRLNLVAMGDFNDAPESDPVQAIIGHNPFQLFDVMPVDSEGGHDTHFWKSRGLFSRIDYLLASPGMAAEFVEGSARIADLPAWKDASDHRALYARFLSRDMDAPPADAADHGFRRFVPLITVIAVLLVIAAASGIIIGHKLSSRNAQD